MGALPIEVMAAGIGHNNPPAPVDMLAAGSPVPVSMGRCADLYHDVRELRLMMEKEVEKIKARETELSEHLIANLTKGADTGAAGLFYRAQVVNKPKQRVSEERGGWPALWSWIKQHDRFDMLQKRLADTAAADFTAAGNTLPGVETVQVPTLSITKIAR